MRSLDKNARINITMAVLQHAFADRAKALLDEEDKLIAAIIDRAYPKKIQHHMQALIEFSAPREPFDTFSFLTVRYAGVPYAVGPQRPYYDPKSAKIELEVFLNRHVAAADRTRTTNIPVLMNNYGCFNPIIHLDRGDKLGERIEAYGAARDQLEAEINSKRGSVMGILATCRTEEQLKAKWPEVMPIAEQFLVERKAPSREIALVTDDLNADLKLPPQNDNAAAEVAA